MKLLATDYRNRMDPEAKEALDVWMVESEINTGELKTLEFHEGYVMCTFYRRNDEDKRYLVWNPVSAERVPATEVIKFITSPPPSSVWKYCHHA